MSEPVKICYDRNRSTCVEVDRTERWVRYIPLNILGLVIEKLSVTAFDERYMVFKTAAPERACRQYLEFGLEHGMSYEVETFLTSICKLTKEERSMASKKKAAPSKVAPKKAAPKKANGKAAAPKKETKNLKNGKSISAAKRFQDLIMEGKLTDAEIFEAVQKEFNLDDKKRSYVAWYRNYLTKKGENPPAART